MIAIGRGQGLPRRAPAAPRGTRFKKILRACFGKAEPYPLWAHFAITFSTGAVVMILILVAVAR